MSFCLLGICSVVRASSGDPGSSDIKKEAQEKKENVQEDVGKDPSSDLAERRESELVLATKQHLLEMLSSVGIVEYPNGSPIRSFRSVLEEGRKNLSILIGYFLNRSFPSKYSEHQMAEFHHLWGILHFADNK